MIAYLFITGIAFLFVGLSCLLDPVATLTPTLGIHLEGVNAFSQTRGSSGGVTTALGVFLAYAAMQPRLHVAACWMVVVVLGGLEAGRVFSLIADGLPGIRAWISMAFEWLGLVQGIYWLRQATALERDVREGLSV